MMNPDWPTNCSYSFDSLGKIKQTQSLHESAYITSYMHLTYLLYILISIPTKLGGEEYMWTDIIGEDNRYQDTNDSIMKTLCPPPPPIQVGVFVSNYDDTGLVQSVIAVMQLVSISTTVNPRLSEPRLSEPSIIRTEFQAQ